MAKVFLIVAALAALTRAAPTVGDGPAKIDVAGIEIKPVAELGGKFFALGGYGAGGGHGLGYGGGYSHGYNVNVYTLVVHRRQTSSTSSIQQGCYGGNYASVQQSSSSSTSISYAVEVVFYGAAYNRFYRADGTVVTDEKDIDEFAASFVPKDDIDAPIGE